MRAALIALCLVGCIQEHDRDYPPDDYWTDSDSGWGSGWGGGDGLPPQLGCASDSECGGLTCTRTGECLDPSLVHTVRTLWTVQGAPASDTSCSAVPKLSITFSDRYGTTGSAQWGYTPVPCNAGKFTIDKFPTRYTMVQLAREGDYYGGDAGSFDSEGTAMLDLPY